VLRRSGEAASAAIARVKRDYRVRARNARIRVMRRTTLTSTCKNEAVEPRTIVIIMRFLGGVMY
jgi:hypothetical protein